MEAMLDIPAATSADQLFERISSELRRVGEPWWRQGYDPNGIVAIVVRRGGRIRRRTIGTDGLLPALQRLEAERYGLQPELVEITLTGPFQNQPFALLDKALPNTRRGLMALRIEQASKKAFVLPTEVIATNRTHGRMLEAVVRRDGIALEQATVAAAPARVMLVWFKGEEATEPVPLYRCAPLVSAAQVTGEMVDGMMRSMSEWLYRSVGSDGCTLYKYWPAKGEQSPNENSIRRFMATVALQQAAGYYGNDNYREAAERSLRWNLERYYKEYGRLGGIEWQGKAKLGAAGLAVIALLGSERRADYADTLRKLLTGILALWRDDGSFKTFLKPSSRNDLQNFYPGEALLAMVLVYMGSRDQRFKERLQAKLLQSFGYYRNWHLQQRNPAFVPWHTQAWTLLYRALGLKELAQFVFDMNDWLLEMQQIQSAPEPDLRGRFYHPRHPEYGPPHASSTGVYLEGLADACWLARRLGDRVRLRRYAGAVREGLRSINQLQYKDWRDTYYLSNPERVLGAVRTEAYNNEIRVDNVQHPLMAMLKAKRLGLL